MAIPMARAQHCQAQPACRASCTCARAPLALCFSLFPRVAALLAAACFDVLCRWTQCYAVANTCWFSTDPYNNMAPCQYLYSLGSVALFWQFFISMASVGPAPPLTGGNWVAHAPAQSITLVSMGASSALEVGAAPHFQRQKWHEVSPLMVMNTMPEKRIATASCSRYSSCCGDCSSGRRSAGLMGRSGSCRCGLLSPCESSAHPVGLQPLLAAAVCRRRCRSGLHERLWLLQLWLVAGRRHLLQQPGVLSCFRSGCYTTALEMSNHSARRNALLWLPAVFCLQNGL